MSRTIKIGKENAQFQILHALKTNRKKRNQYGFLVEGVRNINGAVKYNWEIKAFLYSSEKGLSGWAEDILENSKAATHYDFSPRLLRQLSGKKETSELLALVVIPQDDLNKIDTNADLLVVVLDRPSNPGNLGTIIRSCDALGVDGLIITGRATDVYDPETISATTGSLFSLPIVRLPSQDKLEVWLDLIREKYPSLQVLGTDENGSDSIYSPDFKKPTVLLVGNEKWGLSEGFKNLADLVVKIPMQDLASASSLNVAVATSIAIFEANRQRNEK